MAFGDGGSRGRTSVSLHVFGDIDKSPFQFLVLQTHVGLPESLYCWKEKKVPSGLCF